jgi:phosphonate transport system substrate-binding protein
MKKSILLLLIALNAHLCAEENIPKQDIHFKTYLTPSIPQELYKLIADYINKTTCLNIVLSFELIHSGPPKNIFDPFSSEKIDIAHICSPPFIWLMAHDQPSVELLPIAPIFSDERAHGKPVYFSDVIVAANSLIKSFDELEGKTWCYNDPESLSGYFCMLQKLAHIQQTPSFFSTIYKSGSHLRSIKLVANGTIDGSAIDSNVLALQCKKHPALKQKIRVIKSWGPFPIQPLVARKGLPDDIKKIFVTALLQMAIDEKDALAEYFVDGFGPISNHDFDDERKLLRDCESIIDNVKRNNLLRIFSTQYNSFYTTIE